MATAMMQRRVFKVRVQLFRNRISISPNRLEVPRGSLVEWEFASGIEGVTINVVVYFDAGSPFPWRESGAVVQPQKGSAITGVPESPGEFKYGIRASDARTREELGDEDPWLVVL